MGAAKKNIAPRLAVKKIGRTYRIQRIGRRTVPRNLVLSLFVESSASPGINRRGVLWVQMSGFRANCFHVDLPFSFNHSDDEVLLQKAPALVQKSLRKLAAEMKQEVARARRVLQQAEKTYNKPIKQLYEVAGMLEPPAPPIPH